MAGRGHRDIFAKDIVWGRGTGDGVSYAGFLMDEDDAHSPRVILTNFAPGEVVEPHSHGTNYFEYVVSGEQTVGKTRFGPGDVRFAKAGAGYGPITIGPEGCSVVIVFQDGTGAMTIPMGKGRTMAEASA
jgi:anti-sigma factor ChrR (cupin superfamily)